MISAVILTKNEEKHIIDCIDSLAFCKEIIVIDDDSTDRTVDLVKSLGDSRIHIYHREMNGNFSAPRNFALKHVSEKWTLFIDADERVSEELSIDVIRAIEQEQYVGFWIRRRDYLWEKELLHGEQGNIKLLRLARTDVSKNRWKGLVHEVLDISGLIGELEHPLHHYPHVNTFGFLQSISRYSSLRAEELFSRHVKTNVFEIIFYPIGKFFQNYVFRAGYKDGLEGFIAAMMMSFHSYLVRSKLYLLHLHEK